MSSTTNPSGPPDIQIAGLKIWVLGRQYEQHHDFYDGNWLQVVAHCTAEGGHVEVGGPIILAPELSRWLEQLRACHEKLNGDAVLNCLEPNLCASLSLKDGRGDLNVKITPDHLNQQHEFAFRVDQSYLPALMKGLERVLRAHPVRGAGKR